MCCLGGTGPTACCKGARGGHLRKKHVFKIVQVCVRGWFFVSFLLALFLSLLVCLYVCLCADPLDRRTTCVVMFCCFSVCFYRGLHKSSSVPQNAVASNERRHACPNQNCACCSIYVCQHSIMSDQSGVPDTTWTC